MRADWTMSISSAAEAEYQGLRDCQQSTEPFCVEHCVAQAVEVLPGVREQSPAAGVEGEARRVAFQGLLENLVGLYW